ncbi:MULTISPECIES: Lmo0850 family protein [Staphylococcus]|uniref:Lmo0850 family protein n=1 Tax=Staphylococcus hsinchuensis TaxID=3051183 RepID=A0ABZ3EDJ7_9STAP|nr:MULTISPECIES: Lmo0850 family protein [unclassified Staphylococcus]
MTKENEKIQNVVQLLSSLGVNIKKTKSRLDVMHSLSTNVKAANQLK